MMHNLMLSPQEFAAEWGEDRFCFPPDILRDVDIPEPSKRFLLETGLPLRAEVQMDLYAVLLPPVLASAPIEATKYPLLSRYPSTQFRLLAYVLDDLQLLGAEYRENSVYYAVEEGTGHVYRIWPGDEIEAGRFVNTSLAQFAEFLLYYREFLAHFRLDRSQHEPLLTSLKQKWRQIDPMALTDPDNYWVMCLYYQF